MLLCGNSLGETFRSAGVTDRVTTIGQSFFDPLPAGADLYLLRGVINDWPDREATAILSRCAEAARSTVGLWSSKEWSQTERPEAYL
jgi:hypothetical protein